MNNPLTRKIVASNIIALTSGTGLSQFATALALFLTARALGKDSFGMYAASFALSKMTAVLFNLGLDIWLLREGRRGLFSIRSLIGTSLAIKTVLGAVWFIIILGLSRFLDNTIYPVNLLSIAAITTWLEAILTTTLTGFNIALKNQKSAIINSIAALSLLASTGWLIFSGQSEVILYASIRLVISLGVMIIGIGWFWRFYHLNFQRAVHQQAKSEILPYSLSEALVVIYTQADITIIAMTLGKSAAGLYSPASSIMRSLFFIPQAVHMVMVPVISQFLANRNPNLLSTFRRQNLIQIGIGAILWLTTALFGPILISLILGEDFYESALLLEILSPILLIKALSLGMATLIVAADYQKYRVLVQALAAGLNLALNLMVVHRWGVSGVAWVYVISESILLVGYMFLVKHWLRKRV